MSVSKAPRSTFKNEGTVRRFRDVIRSTEKLFADSYNMYNHPINLTLLLIHLLHRIISIDLEKRTTIAKIDMSL